MVTTFQVILMIILFTSVVYIFGKAEDDTKPEDKRPYLALALASIVALLLTFFYLN